MALIVDPADVVHAFSADGGLSRGAALALAQWAGITPTQVEQAVADYLTANPPTGGVTAGIPIETFLETGETLDPTGGTDTSTILNRALSQVPLDGGKVQIAFPAGVYLLNAPGTLVTSRPGVGVRGAGTDLTTFKLGPAAEAAFMGTGSKSSGTTLAGHVFSDFTIDGSEQVGASSSDSNFKGFRMSIVRDTVLERVRVVDTWASGFGLDFLRNVTFIACEAIRCGRGINLYAVTGHGAGFGIGVGVFPDESALFLGCRTESTMREGWNFEYLPALAESMNAKMRLIGCTSHGDAVGVGDHGTGGIHMVGCTIEAFTNAGVVIAPGGQAQMGGADGVIDKTTVIRGGVNTGSPYADISGGHGIAIRGESASGYQIDAQIEDCDGAGIWFEPGFSLAPEGIRIGATIRRCADGVRMHGSRNLDTGVRFVGGEYEDNGVALDLASSLNGVVVADNLFISKSGGQATAIRFNPQFTLTSPDIRDNTAVDTGALVTGYEGSIGSNLEIASGADPNLIYYDDLTAPSDTVGLGDGWITVPFVSGIFQSTANWRRGPNGAAPDTTAPSTNQTGQYRNVGRVDARISAVYNATLGSIGRRGIVHSLNTSTGAGVYLTTGPALGVAEMFQVEVNQNVVEVTDISATTNYELALEHDAGTSTYRAYLNGDLIWEDEVVGVGETQNVGLVGARRYLGTLMNVSIRAK